MSTDIWKIEKDLCRCCHTEGTFRNLTDVSIKMNPKEMYSEMLQESFNIEICPLPGIMWARTYTICDLCIQRLNEAHSFKKQVMSCEMKLQDLFKKSLIAVSESTEIKIEISEDDFKPDIASENCDNFGDDLDVKSEEDDDEYVPEITQPKRKLRARTKIKPVKTKSASKKEKRKKGTKNAENSTDLKQVKDDDLITKTKEEPLEDGDKMESGAKREENEERKVMDKLPKRVKKRRNFFRPAPEDFTNTTCNICQKTFKTLKSLKSHLRFIHYGSRQYKCEFCTESFKAPCTLERHKSNKHDIDTTVPCNACPAILSNAYGYRRHILHFHRLGVKKHKCECCDFESLSRNGLFKHKYKHKPKEFSCKFCQKLFRRKTNLQVHERIHTGDRRKVCEICSQAFVQKASLNYHMTKYHPDAKF